MAIACCSLPIREVHLLARNDLLALLANAEIALDQEM
jgi:hypothetical protein